MKDSDIDYTKPRFELGVVLVTPAGLAALEAAQIPEVLLLARHVHGDWGELSEEDSLQNELAMLLGLRLLSSYPLPTGGKVWVITEADRSATTILLQDDY